MGETSYYSGLLLVVDETPPIQGESINKSKKARRANAYRKKGRAGPAPKPNGTNWLPDQVRFLESFSCRSSPTRKKHLSAARINPGLSKF
jgi:hypothetical protein